MIVSVRDISARCSRCGGTDFRPQRKGRLKLSTRMSCERCAHVTTYRELLEGIGEQAMLRANEALEKLKEIPKRRAHRK
jgi:hypothetical protein